MNIIQITDLHILSEHEQANGIDTAGNFLKVLDEIKATEVVDRLVISGDLCLQDPLENVYDFVISTLKATDYKFNIISGNHDQTSMYSHQLTGTKLDEMYYESEDILFLDTASGAMSDEQWLWLANKLQHWHKDFITIFMHHPPLMAQVPHLDNNYPFREISRFKNLLSKFPGIRFDVFTGHYHVERSIIYKNCHLFITPSCFVQIADDTAAFKVDHSIPSYRRINYDEEGNLTTTVRYLFPK